MIERSFSNPYPITSSWSAAITQIADEISLRNESSRL